MPTSINPTFISSISEMTDASAKSNVIAPLRELLLIDESGKPTELMERWRHDDEYPAVCAEIRDKVYPSELIEAFGNPTTEQEPRIKTWFAKKAKVGDVAARMYTSTYILLCEADPSKSEETQTKPKRDSGGRPKKSKGSIVTRDTTPTNQKVEANPGGREDISSKSGGGKNFPSIHIDVQVHISPDTTSEQIDKIFESMSKHLSNFTN